MGKVQQLRTKENKCKNFSSFSDLYSPPPFFFCMVSSHISPFYLVLYCQYSFSVTVVNKTDMKEREMGDVSKHNPHDICIQKKEEKYHAI